MTFVKGLACRECNRPYPTAAVHVCEFCFGPLEVSYDYDAITRSISRAAIERRAPSMWRYAELLPLDTPPTVGTSVGFTPLHRAVNLERRLEVKELWIKNDAVCSPSLSFKDRVVSVAISKARELGMGTIGCASTGDLANSVAANSAAAGMPAYVLIPQDLERSKILGTMVYGANVVGIAGTYDDVNRLCSEVAGKYGWAFVNVNMRPFYAEGSKSFAYEIAEQLGWRVPDHLVAPMAGGSLLTKIDKAFKEMVKVGLLPAGKAPVLHGAQGSGCAPIVEAVRQGWEQFKPVKKPTGIAKSLAIGNPADGFYAARAIRDTGGWAAAPDDAAIVAAMRLLAESEGIFTETAGGVTLAATQQLLAEGRIPRDACIVVSVTGNGLKTTDPLEAAIGAPPVIAPNLRAFDELVARTT
jgi:threonine synthase